MTTPSETCSSPLTGILLVGHGTREARGRAEFHQAAAMLRGKLAGATVADSFLELAEPDIDSGIRLLAAEGMREIIIVPVLLFAAGHAKEDIPAAVAKAAGRHKGLAVRWAQPLDCHGAIVRLSARRFREAIEQAGVGNIASEDCTLLFVGRGASDAQAIARVHEFAARRVEASPVRRHIVCFLAAAGPTLEDAIQIARTENTPHIVVQPHLLFHGRLADEVQTRVEQLNAQRKAGDPHWHFARHLGPEAELAEALLDRIREAAQRS